jgi:hypothetical protein
MKALHVLPLVIALTACNLQLSKPVIPVLLPGDVPQTWLDAPLDQMHLRLAPYEVVFHGSDDSAIAAVELRINDQPVAIPPLSSVGKKLVTAKYLWSPSVPGQYVLKARSLNSAGRWSAEAQVTVWVGDLTTATPTLTTTPTASATTPAPPVAAGFSLLSASTDHFYYGASTCGPTSVRLEVQVSDAQQIHDVLLFFKLRNKNSGNYTDWSDGTDMQAEGNGKYTISLVGNSIAASASGNDWLIYQFVGTGAENKPAGRSQVYSDISFSICGRGIFGVPPPG